MSRIGIFGGSFDPIHNGHIGVAERAIKEHSLDKVLVVPAKVSPFKVKSGPLLDDDARWRMVAAACAGHPSMEPCDVELKRGGVSYAIDTVQTIKDEHPGDKLFFILGEDSVAGLPQWKDYARLRTLCRFVSFPRTPESSTEIRRRIERGEPYDDMVPPEVAEILRGISAQPLLPHKPPMVLIDEIESFDAAARAITAKVTITPSSPFFGRTGFQPIQGGVPSWVAIEYMAQTVAAMVGRFDRIADPSAKPRPGLLLGTRRLSLRLERFECGRTYHIRAKEEYSDYTAMAFACDIADDDGNEVASAILSTYRPQSIDETHQ